MPFLNFADLIVFREASSFFKPLTPTHYIVQVLGSAVIVGNALIGRCDRFSTVWDSMWPQLRSRKLRWHLQVHSKRNLRSKASVSNTEEHYRLVDSLTSSSDGTVHTRSRSPHWNGLQVGRHEAGSAEIQKVSKAENWRCSCRGRGSDEAANVMLLQPTRKQVPCHSQTCTISFNYYAQLASLRPRWSAFYSEAFSDIPMHHRKRGSSHSLSSQVIYKQLTKYLKYKHTAAYFILIQDNNSFEKIKRV